MAIIAKRCSARETDRIVLLSNLAGNIFMTPNSAPLNPDEEPAANGTLINSSNYVNSSSYHKLHNMNVAFQLMEDANLPVRKISMMHCASVGGLFSRSAKSR